jgi:hypothetical protein
VIYVFEWAKLAAPRSIVQLPCSVFDCLHRSSRVDSHLLDTWFQRAIITLDISALLFIHFYEVFDFRYAFNLGWPVQLGEWVGPPTFCGVPDGPCDAVVENSIATCLLKFLVEIGEILFSKLVFTRIYCSRAPT